MKKDLKIRNLMTVWDEIEAYRKSKTFTKDKIYWLVSLWNNEEPSKSEISKADYAFIRDMQTKTRKLKPWEVAICNKIYERYQSKDVR